MKTKICVRCEQEYIPTGKNQKVCRLCARIIKQEYLKAYKPKLLEARSGYGLGKGGNQRGGNNHQWKGGTSLFKRIKLSSLNGTYFCERCGKDLKQFVTEGKKNGMWAVHHKDHNRQNPSLENLELLCKKCHQIEHKCWNSFKT